MPTAGDGSSPVYRFTLISSAIGLGQPLWFLPDAPPSATIAGTGGPLVGGTTPQPTISFAVSGSGGPLVSEAIAQPTITFAVSTSGGPVIASTFAPITTSNVVGSGGPIVGQHIAPPFLSFFPTLSGGVLIASHTNGTADFPIVATGGPVVASTFTPTINSAVAGSGGVLVGVTTTQPSATVTVTGSGGVVISERLQPPQPPAVFFVTGSGGVIVTASTDQARIAGGFYHVYMNHGTGDAVDYDFAVETTSITSWTTPSLPYPGDYSFHVRAFYGSPYLEEHNLDARIRVVLDAAGIDVTGRPAAPTGLAATATKGGQVRLSWLYKTPLNRFPPSKFNVYSGTPGVSYASPTMMISYGSDGRYFAVVSGLVNGSTYQFVVRAANATAEEPNTNIVTAMSDSSGPNPPQDLVAVSI